MKTVLLLICLALMTACASWDGRYTKIRPYGTDGDAKLYQFEAWAGHALPLESPKAEAIRLNWLDERMHEMGYQPHEYTVVAREYTKRAFGAWLADSYEVFYTVQVNR
jgi:hypothetical protein